MPTWRAVNRWLIAAFGEMSGGYKVNGGEADLQLFGALGLSPAGIQVFGLVQAMSGFALALAPIGAPRPLC